MITFYRNTGCRDCARIAEKLREMSLAHDVVEAGTDAPDRKGREERQQLPCLKDDDKVIEGHGRIAEYIEQLEQFKGEWDKFQSDACYCDE